MVDISKPMNERSSRALILLVLLPLLCLLPWILVTGPTDLGRRLGFISEFKVQSIIDGPALTTLVAKEAEATQPKQPSANAGQLDLLLTREAAARLLSVSATAMLILVASLAGFYGWVTAWRLTTKPDDRVLLWLAVLAVVALIWLTWPREGHRIYDLLGVGVFSSTIGKLHARSALDLLDRQQFANNIVLVIAGVGLSFAAALVAMQASRLKGIADRAAYVTLKRRLDRILIASGLLLAAGIIDLKQWTALPLPFISDATLATAYSSFTGGFVALQSLFYVAGLVTMFLPPAWLLEKARERITSTSAPKTPPADAPLPAAGFAVADLLRVAAMLAPILVGPVANFINLKIAG